MNLQTGRLIPAIRRPQILGIAAVLVIFLLVELVVGEHGRRPVVVSNEAQTTTIR